MTYETRGVSPNREFIVQFEQDAYRYHTTAVNTFQFVLYESTNDIRVNYRDVTSFGERETAAGIENADGTTGLQYTPLSQPGRYRNYFYVHYSHPIVNHAPVADAGEPQTVDAGGTVTLHGSGSSDPDGDTISYQWTRTAGPAVTLLNSTTATPTFTAPNMGTNGGTLTFSLVVTDREGLASTADSVTVTVNPSSSSTTPEPGLYFPHVKTDGEWETEICLINTDGHARLEGDLKAYDNTGDEIGSLPVDLPANGRREIVVGTEFEDPDEIGYIVFESTSGGDAVGYLKLYVEGQYRLAIPAVAAGDVNTGDIYIPHIASVQGWTTRIGLLNTTLSAKDCVIEFNDGTEQRVTLEAREHTTFTIESLGVAQPGIHSAVISGASGVIAVEELESGTWLCGVLLKDDLATRIYFPHIPSDGGWVTGLVAYNPFDTECLIRVIPYDASGGALLMSQLDTSVGGKDNYVGLVSNDRLFKSVDGVLESTPGLDLSEAAWLAIESTGGSGGITGLDLFATLDPQPQQYAGFSAVGMQGKGGIFAKLGNPDCTGIAFVNIEGDPAQVDWTAYDDSGETLAEGTIPMAGLAKQVDLASALFPGIDGATYIRYSSDRELVGFQMNVLEGGMMLDGLEALRVDPVSAIPEAFIDSIDSPADGEELFAGEDITFTGRCVDPVEGTVTIQGIMVGFIWKVDGKEIGNGNPFTLSGGLSAGRHTVTLTVTVTRRGEPERVKGTSAPSTITVN